MNNTWAIVQKELRQYFVSPIAYVVMMIFLTLSGYFFCGFLVNFSARVTYFKNQMQYMQDPEALSQLSLNQMVIAPSLFNMIFIFLFILPLIMMRTFAEEKRQKTDELLMTSPITMNQLIAGKFVGSLLFILMLIAPTAIYQFGLFKYAQPELGPVLTGYLGIILFAAGGVSIGLFASSLTENQIIAAIVTFVLLLFQFVINVLGQREGILFSILNYLSVAEHISNLLKGMIDTRDLVYFVSVIALFLFLTKRSVESVKWRSS
jgi:ABC-2 type transport system permease protein